MKEKVIDFFKTLKEKYKSQSKYEHILQLFFVVIFVIFSVLVVRQGLVCNDELELHLNRLFGMDSLLSERVETNHKQGRPFLIPNAINQILTWTSANVYVARSVQCLVIFGAIFAFYKLICEMFNKRTGYIASFIVLLFYTIGFELGTPNAFNGITCIPLMEMCIALNYWVKFLKSNKKGPFITSCIFFGLAIMGYEYMVTYSVALFLTYLFYRKEKISFLDMIKCLIIPALECIAYMGLIFGYQKFMTQGYGGTQVDLSNIKGILHCIATISYLAIPGVFRSIPRHRIVFNYYNQTTGEEVLVSNIIPVILLAIFLVYILISKKTKALIGEEVQEEKNEKSKEKNKIKCLEDIRNIVRNNTWIKCTLIALSLLVFTVLPILPNSITQLYQETVSFWAFAWIPVSTLVYFAWCLVFALIIDKLLNKIPKTTIAGIVVILLVLVVPGQFENKVMSNRSNESFKNLNNMWTMTRTATFAKLEGKELYSKDMFETYDLLAFTPNYWNRYLSGYDINVKINFLEEDKEEKNMVRYYNHEYFIISTEEEVAIISPKIINQDIIVELSNDSKSVVTLDAKDCMMDNTMYVYGFKITEQGLEKLDDVNLLFGGVGA